MIGQRLGSFQIEAKLGAGAMGEVYLATQHLKDGRTRRVAVKVVSADFLERDLALKRFLREAEILAQLRHPNIVRYYAHGKAQGIYYYGMEFVKGETLDALLSRREFLPWTEVVELGIQLCQALQYAHDHQVVHRDLKPSNLMITDEGKLKLTDFGIAKDLDATINLTRTGRTLGTAAYMAPEQIRGNPPISHKTDLYALGCLLYQMLTGRVPFEGKSAVVLMHAHMSQAPPRPSDKTPDVPRSLDELVVKLMAKEPADRPWDAAQVAHQLEELRERHRRGERVEMAFDRARSKLAASGAALLPTVDGETLSAAPVRPGPEPPTRQGTKPRGTSAGRKAGARAAAVVEEEAPWLQRHRRALETGGLALALAGLIGLLAYLLWPPGMEALYAKAEALMQSDSRPDWKRAINDYVAPIERRFPDHPYAETFASWRDRIALDEAEGRAVQLESPTPLGRPRSNRPVEAMYKTVLTDIAPFDRLGQHALVALRWQRFVEDLTRRNDPEDRGWLLLGMQRYRERLEALEQQRREAANLYQQAMIHLRAGRDQAARRQLEALVDSFGTAAQGDAVLLGLVADAQAGLDELADAPAGGRSDASPPGGGAAGRDPDPDGPAGGR